MSPVDALMRWHRPVAPGPPRTDLRAVLDAAARSLGAFTAAGVVFTVATPQPVVRELIGRPLRAPFGAALGSLVLVGCLARVALRLCRAPPERAAARAATVAASLAASAVAVGALAHVAPGVAVAACGWLLAPATMFALAFGRSTAWDAAWPSPAPRAVERGVVAVAALGALLAVGLVAAPSAARGVVLPGIADVHRPPAPWRVLASDHYHGHWYVYTARVGAVCVIASEEAGPMPWAPGRGSVRLSEGACERPPERWSEWVPANEDGLPWRSDEAVEVLHDAPTRRTTLRTGSGAARFEEFSGGYGVTRRWTTAVAAPRRSAWGLLAGWALGVALALDSLRRTRAVAAAIGPLDAWRDGRLSVDGAIAPAEGGAPVRVAPALVGRSGAVAFRSAAASPVGGDTYRGASRAEAAEVFLGTRGALGAAVAQVRGAWAPWALVVATAAAAPLVVALLTSG